MALTAILGNCCLRQYALLAQSAEQLTLNQWVPGSIPGERTKPQFLLTRTGVSYSRQLSCIKKRALIPFGNKSETEYPHSEPMHPLPVIMTMHSNQL